MTKPLCNEENYQNYMVLYTAWLQLHTWCYRGFSSPRLCGKFSLINQICSCSGSWNVHNFMARYETNPSSTFSLLRSSIGNFSNPAMELGCKVVQECYARKNTS